MKQNLSQEMRDAVAEAGWSAPVDGQALVWALQKLETQVHQREPAANARKEAALHVLYRGLDAMLLRALKELAE